MDYFNATVHNGNFVSKRRGLRVSKTEHNGIRFVNTFAAVDGRKEPKRAPVSRQRYETDNGSGSGAGAGDRGDGREGSIMVLGGAGSMGSAGGESVFSLDDTRVPLRPRVARSLKTRPRIANPKPEDDKQDKRRHDSTASDSGNGSVVQVITPPSSVTSYGDAQTTSQSTALVRHDYPSDVSHFGVSSYSPLETYNIKHYLSHPYTHQNRYNGNGHRFIHLYLNYAPRFLYPEDELLQYNPFTSTNLFRRLNVDPVSMESIVMVSMLLRSIIIGNSGWGVVGPSTTRLCRMVTSRLSQGKVAGELAVLEGISAMAIAGMFLGHFDHWKLHMKGLRSVVARSDGLKSEWGHVLDKVRKADVRGAAASGYSPLIDFVKFHPPASSILPGDVRASLSSDIDSLLRPAGVASIIIKSVTDLACYANTIKMAREGSFGSARFEPFGYAEEYYWVEDQLVRYPNGLRRDDGIDDKTPQDHDPIPEEGDVEYGSLAAPTSPIIKPILMPSANMMDPVVRIAGILYVEELFQSMRCVQPYSIPLSMLSDQLRLILARLQRRIRRSPSPNSLSPAAAAPIEDDDLAQTETLRPVLLWVCVVVCAVANLVDTEQWTPLSELVNRSAYQDCIAFLLTGRFGGTPTAADVDALPESDLTLCKALPLRGMQAVSRDERTMLKEIVTDYQARVAVESLPLFV